MLLNSVTFKIRIYHGSRGGQSDRFGRPSRQMLLLLLLLLIKWIDMVHHKGIVSISTRASSNAWMFHRAGWVDVAKF